MSTTPNLGLPYILPQQAQKHVTHNEALQQLDTMVQISVISRSQIAVPPAPANGDRYLGPIGLSGDWQGFDHHLIVYADGAWVALLPQKGWVIWIEDEAQLLVFNGTMWQNTATGLDRLGINASSDLTNRLVVKSDASMFDHDGTSHRLNINKAGSADIATLAFQSNYLTLAEIGLAGEDIFSIKVSADGTTFNQALSCLSTGSIGAGTTSPASRLHIKDIADARLTIDTTTSGSGGGFDIINSGDAQSWRVTGEAELLKFRDHTAGLDKFIINRGSTGDVEFINCGNIGLGKTAPSARLDVDGAVRVGTYTVTTLPSASLLGAGAMIYVSNAPGGPGMAVSDGADWRQLSDKSLL